MNFRRKLLILVILIILIWSFVGYLPGDSTLVSHYAKNVYIPYQGLRGKIFGYIPFSIGDALYVLAGFGAISAIVRWIYYAIKFGLYTAEIAASFLNTVNTVLFVYLLFIMSWGANYYKQPLSKYWRLDQYSLKPGNGKEDPTSTKAVRARDSTALVSFDLFLIDKLNRLAPYYSTLSFSDINRRSEAYYDTFTVTKVKGRGLWIKPSLFSMFIERIGVEGYYNPFTGEGQINTDLPGFMLPFLVCHEMAHQTGIAAEGDANLMAYTLCTTTADTSFRYSAYLNIWLYTNNRIYHRDSVLANKFEAKLNALTKAHLDTLDDLSRKYHNEVARYSSKLFDSYLKMEDQKEGIGSYSDVTISAWQVELGRKKGSKELIDIP